ncbi:MAG: acyl-CoA dehydrogenase, partial [Alphaproteobacteria bacterium]
SALTFNPHRIHYDQPYCTQEEGYPGLVVHGPLIATLMVDLCRRSRPDAEVKEFSFRALSPLFVDHAMTLGGAPSDEGSSAAVWAANDQGGLASQGEVKFA